MDLHSAVFFKVQTMPLRFTCGESAPLADIHLPKQTSQLHTYHHILFGVGSPELQRRKEQNVALLGSPTPAAPLAWLYHPHPQPYQTAVQTPAAPLARLYLPHPQPYQTAVQTLYRTQAAGWGRTGDSTAALEELLAWGRPAAPCSALRVSFWYGVPAINILLPLGLYPWKPANAKVLILDCMILKGVMATNPPFVQQLSNTKGPQKRSPQSVKEEEVVLVRAALN
ncbi:hypothetical protein UY3_09956 [Chelonia mydas]|uniref:Uncharacterized protein n=1 Tax=Chelonia mydas TaxID=8469 RepID=M7B4S2_CHEMY|nr:hypothetical protein UY3_09956 [Chelonia mydas]